MSITAITIENFKGIKEPVRIELNPVTLLFGPNSSGKSTIIHALHYAREIFERLNTNPDKTLHGGDTIDLGGFENLVHRHDLSLPIIMRFDLDLEKEGLPVYLDGLWEENQWFESGYEPIPGRVKSAWVELTVKWNDLTKTPIVCRYSVGINGKKWAEIETTEDGRQVHLSKINLFNPIFFDGETIEECLEKSDKFYYYMTNILNNPDIERPEFESAIFSRIFDLFNCENGIPGIEIPIPLGRQRSALPNWHKN